MAVAVPFHFTTVAGTPVAVPVRAGQSGKLKGFAYAGVAGLNALKIWWYIPTASAEAPVVGTTPPNLTIAFASGANDHDGWPDGITGNGQMFVTVTLNPVDSDATAATANAVVTLFVE